MNRHVCLVAVLLVLGAPVFAKEKSPAERYAKKESAFRRAIAARYAKAGDEMRKDKYFQFARILYKEALTYDVNQRDARKQMGYVWRGTKWVVDPRRAKLLPDSNSRPQNVSEDTFKREMKQKYDETKKKADVYAAAKYAGLGTWCKREGLDDQAKKAWIKAIGLDPENEIARKGMGYVKVGNQWLTPKQKQAREDAKNGKIVNTPSRFESALGLKLNKMESAHFHVETVMPVAALKDYVKTLETTYAYFLRDVGEPETKDLWGRKAEFLVLGTKQQWYAYVDRFAGGSAFMKKTQGSMSVQGLFGVQYKGTKGTHKLMLDGLVHKLGHMLAYSYWNVTQAWLQEGFAYYYTVKVLNSTATHCVALGTYARPGNGEKNWGQSQNWRDLEKKDVSTHADPDIRMFYKLPISELQYNASVKAWSIISWLFDKHRKEFMKWLDLVGHKGVTQEAATQQVFHWSFEQMDKAWRAFVLATY